VNKIGLFKKVNPVVVGAGYNGQTLVEFGLIIALVSLTMILVLGLMSDSIRNSFEEISDKISEAIQ
jgi:Flp pilus assembly pilin Flp